MLQSVRFVLRLRIQHYMRQPEGFESGGHNLVLRLNKAVYGLKQASRQWKQKLVSILIKLGFKEIYSDASLYVYARDKERITMPVYVDDGMMSSNSPALLDWAVLELSKHVKLRDLGASSFLLGMLIERDCPARMLAISQRQYILDMLVRYNMDKCDVVRTPMNPSLRLSKAQGPQTAEEIEAMRSVPYAEAVGSLLYLARGTRPDIAYSVAFLSRFVANPGRAHWQAVKHLFRYLQGTKDLRLVYRGGSVRRPGPVPRVYGLCTRRQHRHRPFYKRLPSHHWWRSCQLVLTPSVACGAVYN